MQSDDRYATITAALARLMSAYHDLARTILEGLGAECIINTKKPSLFKDIVTTRTISTMEKNPVMSARDSGEISWEGCYKCHHCKEPHERLKYWIGILLFHAFLLLTTIILLTRLLNLSNAPARKYSSSPSRYCGQRPPLIKKLQVLTGARPAPIREAVKYETLRHKPDAWSNSIYTEASHESHAAWNELVECMWSSLFRSWAGC